jgi:hypothetical protein
LSVLLCKGVYILPSTLCIYIYLLLFFCTSQHSHISFVNICYCSFFIFDRTITFSKLLIWFVSKFYVLSVCVCFVVNILSAYGMDNVLYCILGRRKHSNQVQLLV